jgi:hypothetical protein
MKRYETALLLISLALTSSSLHGLEQAGFAQKPQLPTHKSQGLIDYTLGKINPSDRDYGVEAGAVRRSAVDRSVDDLYFWSNVVTLVLLTGVTTTLFLHLRAADKKEVISADLVTQLWNGRVSDRLEIERRTGQYNSLVERHNAEVERTLRAKSPPEAEEGQAASELKRTVEGLDKRKAKTMTQAQPGATTGSSTAPVGGQSAQGNGAGQQQKLVMLERQIEAMKNTEANLKERLNRTQVQLDQERNRNQALKGA